VVWNAHVKEMTDLAPAQRTLLAAVWAVEAAQREVMQPEKVNLATLGNMTPHVHWHVIRASPTIAISPARSGPSRAVRPMRPRWPRAALLPQLREAVRRHLDAAGLVA
jgi:diadenosine tetraphosphate (Ap4A) HIT family hydrolase